MMLGVCFFGVFVEIILSQFINQIKCVIILVIIGVVIIVIGILLIKVGMMDLVGGFNVDVFGSVENLLLGLGVLLVIIYFNVCKNYWLRLLVIFIGMVMGIVVVFFMGMINFFGLVDLFWFSVFYLFKYGINFEWDLFLFIVLIYFFIVIEIVGDLIVNSLFCKLFIIGECYFKWICVGILGDGVNLLIVVILCIFFNIIFG